MSIPRLGPSRSSGRLVLPDRGRAPVRLEAGEGGYHEGIVAGIGEGTRYLYRLDGRLDRPDPASRSQPAGVHGPSAVLAPAGPDSGATPWRGIPIDRYVLYELHVGTFTGTGTFDAVIPHLDRLIDLGVTVIELMPVGQFPGTRNWGYDGVYPYAVQDSYGGPDGLRRLVTACHRRGLGVALDVVYNHLGPEGNYLDDFGPYFTDRYRTPWGRAINFDGAGSNGVRDYFLGNAVMWLAEYGIDALRLDAIHGIHDHSESPFLAELADLVHDFAERAGRRIYLIAESDLNDVRVLRPRGEGGFGLDAQWNDDLHHALHALLTGERDGYYVDFGRVADLVKAYREGFVLPGGFSAFRNRRHGTSSLSIPASRFVVCAQNHDQVGNRPFGERLSALVSFEALKLAAGAVLLSPFVPLLFMGEEYGETAPFRYFVSHSDRRLIEAVREGRRREFGSVGSGGEPPDPQDEATFRGCRLQADLREVPRHRILEEFHRELLRLRRQRPALSRLERSRMEVGGSDAGPALWIRRDAGREGEVLAVFHFGRREAATIEIPGPNRGMDPTASLQRSALGWEGGTCRRAAGLGRSSRRAPAGGVHPSGLSPAGPQPPSSRPGEKPHRTGSRFS